MPLPVPLEIVADLKNALPGPINEQRLPLSQLQAHAMFDGQRVDLLHERLDRILAVYLFVFPALYQEFLHLLAAVNEPFSADSKSLLDFQFTVI